MNQLMPVSRFPVDPSSGPLDVVRKPVNMTQLPGVLLAAIFQFLSDRKGQTLRRLSLVNHQFEWLQFPLWQSLCLNHFPVYYQPRVTHEVASKLPKNPTAEERGRSWKKLHGLLMSRDYSKYRFCLRRAEPFILLGAETLVYDSRGQIEITDLDDSKPTFLSEQFTGPAKRFKLARLSDGHIASMHDDGNLYVWNPGAPGKPTMTLQTGQSRAYSLASLPNKRIASAHQGKVCVFDLNIPKEAPIILEDGADRIYCLQTLPNGHLVLGDASSSNSLPIRIWDPDASNKSFIKLNMTKGYSYCLTTLPNGQIVSGEQGGDGLICTWDPNAPDAPITQLTGYISLVQCVAALPNGFIASGHSAGLVYIWDLETPYKCLAAFKAIDGPICKLEVLPDGRLLVKGGVSVCMFSEIRSNP